MRDGLYSTLERVLLRADIVVTSCLAAGNLPYFEPTVAIVDQWDTDRDWQCMIPLTAFDQTEFRSITGNFDIPHWRRMWEWKYPITLPVHFSVGLDAHQPFTSMYTMERRISSNTVNVRSQKQPENVSLPPEPEAVRDPADNMARGVDLRHLALRIASKGFYDEPEALKDQEQSKNLQVAETEQKRTTERKTAAEKLIAAAKKRVTEIKIPEIKISEISESSDDIQVAETEKTKKINIEMPQATKQIKDVQIEETEETSGTEIEISGAIERIDKMQIAKTNKTREAGIDYCTAYSGYWYNE